MELTQKITPFLWFNDNAEEALNFYTSLFDNSKIISISRYPDNVPGMEAQSGKVLTAVFELAGQQFMALDGGPMFKPTEALSLFVNCLDQVEIDKLWNAFIDNGGEESQCGWLKDKYGFSWQIIPSVLPELLNDPDRVKADRVMKAMLLMKKIDISKLESAYRGEYLIKGDNL